MKKIFTLLTSFAALVSYAQAPEAKLAAVLNSEVNGTERTIQLGTYRDSSFAWVDWGDGTLVKSDTLFHQNSKISSGNIKGAALGEGVIKIYCDSVWYFGTSSGDKLKSVDVSGLNTAHQISIGGAQLEAIDLSKCDSLRVLSLTNNALKSLDLSANTLLTSLTANCSNTASKENSELTSIDLSNNKQLESLQLQNHKLTSIDLSKNTVLSQVYLNGNKLYGTGPTFAPGLDISFMNLQDNELTSFSTASFTNVKNLYISGNQLATLDLSKLKEGSDLNVFNNQLTELDVPVKVKNFNATNNKLKRVTIVDATASCKLENNYLTIATLPQKPESLNTTSKIKKFTYVPQYPVALSDALFELDGKTVKTAFDLTPEATAIGEGTEAQNTTFTFVTASGTELVEGTDFECKDNIFTFTKPQEEKVILKMQNPAFPKLADANAFIESLPFSVNATLQPILTLKSTAAAAERSFGLAGYEEYDRFYFDMGDGNLVKTDSIFSYPATYKMTTFKGTPTGEGNITLYGNADNLYYFSTYGGDALESTDLSKVTKINTLSVTGANLNAIDLTALTELTSVTLNNNAINTIDLSKNAMLKSLSILNNQLEELNVANNPELTEVKVTGNKLTKLDLSANTKVEQIIADNNQLAEITFNGEAINGTINLANNKLKAVDLSKVNTNYIDVQKNEITALDFSSQAKTLNTLYVNNNQLTSLSIPVSCGNFQANDNLLESISLTNCTKSCKLENNKLTLASLPTKPEGLNTTSKIKKFTYAPQADIEVEDIYNDSNNTLDLSAQVTSTGILTEAVPTTFTLKAGENNLEEGTDYSIADGKITFLTPQADKVYVELTTEAFPLFTAGNVLKTTEFSVRVTSDISEISESKTSATGTDYNLLGQKVTKAKGIIIRNGRKVIMK